ncbi:MAG: membrane-bound lytic murein transglycosylase MltF [Exilibacterium sp.]
MSYRGKKSTRRTRQARDKRHASSWLKRFPGTIALIWLSLALSASRAPTDLENVMQQGTLKILSRNGPTTYYEGPDGLTGFEYTLAKTFANELGVKLEIHDEENLATLLDSVGTARGYLGASGLTITAKRRQDVRFTTPYLEVTQQVLYRAGETKPSGIQDLIGKDLMIIANSSHSERLRELQKRYPELRWRERNGLEMLDLVEMVHNGTIQYTIVDSNAYAINHRIYPRARVAFEFQGTQSLAWAFPRQRDTSLYEAAQRFFQRINTDGTLEEIRDRFYGHVDKVDYSGAMVFARRIKTRLPKWEEDLKTAANRFELDWRLLAAISYQESHWNAKAISSTGVRGLMMLTRATASDMGISNRIDPAQSIYGGAKYFKKIFARMPTDIQGPDRTWLALAAYNVGYGHLEDARVLTEKMGGDPDKWSEVKEHLPKLAQSKYYRTTKHGYARGWEPVVYVQHIRNFYNILAWHNQQKQRQQHQQRVVTLESSDNFQPVEVPYTPNPSPSFL